tara:strand:- start:122 stop:667 length:546 start_codon:yes stop_codon:yes gene_type:complete
MTELENRAHAQKALISSDAMRFFMNATKAEERNDALSAMLKEAKASCQSTDEWVVINLARIEALMDDDDAETAVSVQTEATTAGSLAEAIVTRNVVAAYAMIANRPMIALADATADLDALYRFKNGEQVVISEMLKRESEKHSTQTIKEAVAALTAALDGTYDSEETAVKTAIMKAVTVMS